MHRAEEHEAIRATARSYERALLPEQRKQLGQFFSGIRLGKLLAHMALRPETRAVIDPMAGHGDLLDATWEAATESSITLERLDGIEIDQPTAAVCGTRLAAITANGRLPARKIVAADAFDPSSIAALEPRAYDLVITNPPYVRYQARNAGATPEDKIRSGLISVAEELLFGTDKDIWKSLAEGYSGLADLSVPAWLLSALLVRPGGCLALVVPATWRSRDYADVIRYLLLRCFSLEYVVEDKQPGWFSDALVRTHLIVARRLHADQAAKPLASRSNWATALWLQVAPEAADLSSLVGAAFGEDRPEVQFGAWLREGCPTLKRGMSVRRVALHDEWASLMTRIKSRRWYHQHEGSADDLPLFVNGSPHRSAVVPDSLRDILPDGFSAGALTTLEKAGIQVGQGLRTGCNRFFYVTACGPSEAGAICVEASSFFGHRRFSVPADAVRPVLRRQSELASVEEAQLPEGRVLDLRHWVLPEDSGIVTEAKAAYAACGEAPPRIMPDELAGYVRMAATAHIEGEQERLIPQLSAVCTNVRIPRNGQITPRFWYMLPDFAPRHLPAAFVPRINHGLAWVGSNRDPTILIDANFSTFWAPQQEWTRHSLKVLLNSTWCRAFMEALGTPLGGGALKLEATHLRHMPVPVLSGEAKEELDKAGRQLTRDAVHIQSRIDEIILASIFADQSSGSSLSQLACAMTDRARSLSSARQRAA